MERSEAGTEEHAPASEGLRGRGGGIDETAVERPAQHGPGPPGSSTVEHESLPATVHHQALQEAPASANAPAEQQIGQLQAELAAVKQSLATYESTLQQLLGAQLLPSALRQLQLQHQSSGHVLQGARSEEQINSIASGGARALLAGAPAGQQQQIQRGSEQQSGSMGVLRTSIGSLGATVDPGSEGLSLQPPDPMKLAQQSLQHQHKLEQAIALRPVMTTPEGVPLARLQHQQDHEQTLSAAAAGTRTPPASFEAGSFFDAAADAAISSVGAPTAGVRLLQSSASAPAMGESSSAAATAAAPFSPSPSGPSSSALRLSSSVGAADAIAAPSPGAGGGCDINTGTSLPKLPPGFPTSPEGLLVSPGGSGAASGIRSSPGLNLSPIALAGGMGPPPQQQPQLSTAAGAFPPPLPAVPLSLRQPASLTSPPSGSGGLTPEMAGSSSGGFAWIETAGQSLSGYQQLGQQQQQQRQIVSPSLSHHGLVPDTAGSLSSSLSPSGLAAAAAAAAAAASTAGSFSLMSAVVGGGSAGTTASAFEQDVIPSGSSGDQLMSTQLQALHGSEDVAAAAAAAAAAAEQYVLAQQLQQQHQAVEAAGYGGAAQVAPAEQLLAAMQQCGIQDPAVAAAMIAAAAAGQPGVSPGYGWDPAAAAAVSAGLDQGATASYQAQQAAQALASLNLQAQAAAQAEQLQAYQQAQLMQQLQQQYSNPYAQQLLMAQAAAAAAAATALRHQQWQQGSGRGKLAPAHPGSGSSSGSSRRSSKGTDVYAGSRDARKGSGSKAAGAAGSGAAARSGRGSDEAPDWRRVFVGNIGWWVDEEMLKNVFGEYGSILDAQVMWNTKLLAKGKRVNREFAFISYSTPEEAGVAIRHMHGRYIEGITKDRDGLTVQFEAQGMSKPPPHNHHQQQQQLPPVIQQLTAAAALQQQSAAAVQQQQLLLQQLQQQQQQQGALQLLHQQQQQQQGQFALLQQLQDYQQLQQPDSAAFLGLGSPGLYGSQGGGRPAQGASMPPHTPGGPAV